MRRYAAAPIALFVLALSSPQASAHILTNGRITLDQADGSTGLNTTDQDRVDQISWINSAGQSTGNLAAHGGPVNCGDPQEFFGQSYDDGNGAGLYFVVEGAVSSWTSSVATSGTARTNGKPNCQNLPFSGTVRSTYTLSKIPALVNALKIVRVFRFNAHALAEPFNLRAYVARLPLAGYNTVLAPDASGVVQTYSAGTCAQACAIPSWNGIWFADDNGAGSGMALIRAKSSLAPATVDLDNDSLSASNLTSVVLKLPAGGWAGSLTETEYLCFYDTKTWPAKARHAGRLPIGCAVPVK